ncbi:Hypothetical predicted protein [Olea europaea subsp. europaea]|uniref:Uncharacterized protein n=2 Tax=Olea europaea subsp. europaea TaxID=158383 RepID=A0A8S0PZC5_OLEEU|nr:Hypothetical predicted protein [Olea europaea subsp. europaea]
MSTPNIGIAELYVMKKMIKEKKMPKSLGKKESSDSGSGSRGHSFCRGFHRIHPAAGVLPLHDP